MGTYGTRRWSTRINDAGLDRLQVSVDGVHPNEVTVKVLKPLRKKLETIAKHAKFQVTLNGMIGSAPAGEALEVVAFAQATGCALAFSSSTTDMASSR